MMRLPYFHYHAPRTVQEAAELLAAGDAMDKMLIAGGTDLLPSMKRRQQVPATLIGLRNVSELKAISNGSGLTIGAGVTLTGLLSDTRVREAYGGLWQAARQVATPHLRNMGTIGGNLCLDTRCNYYDQNYEWRKAIDFCMKKDGETCWVATSSPKCLAVSSTDTAPALLSLGASVTLVSAAGRRDLPLADLYRNDGIHYLTRRPDEILTAVHLPRLDGWRSTYWKLRRRGAFDFPVLGVACALKLDASGTVEAARVVLGAVASRPLESEKAAAALIGQTLTDEVIANAAEAAAQPARPMDNTDYTLHWRKRVTRDFVGYALRELRGDDVRAVRRRVARLELLVV
jgi:4-hydroxybenzoyl-CoA reductase subunit beta